MLEKNIYILKKKLPREYQLGGNFGAFTSSETDIWVINNEKLTLLRKKRLRNDRNKNDSSVPAKYFENAYLVVWAFLGRCAGKVTASLFRLRNPEVITIVVNMGGPAAPDLPFFLWLPTFVHYYNSALPQVNNTLSDYL